MVVSNKTTYNSTHSSCFYRMYTHFSLPIFPWDQNKTKKYFNYSFLWMHTLLLWLIVIFVEYHWHMRFLRFLVLLFRKLIVVVTGCYIDGMFLIISLRNHFLFEQPGMSWCVTSTWFTRYHLSTEQQSRLCSTSDTNKWWQILKIFLKVPRYVDMFGTPS